MVNSGPLAGVRILDLTTMIAGPWAAGILADQGADVIKVEESRRGDPMRYAGTRKQDVSCPYFMANRGKRGITLDLRDSDSREALLCLVETADVFLHNSRPGAMERLGLGYDDLRPHREDLIYASISGFGDAGPLSRKGAYDPVMQCFTGMAWMQGGKGAGEPSLIRSIVCDKITALMTAQAISAALYARSNGHGGQQVRVSMLAAAAAFNWIDSCRDEAFLDPDVRVMPSPVEGVRLYRFADGWASVTPAGDKAFPSMLEAFGVEGGDDPRLQSFASRSQHPEVTARVMADWQAKVADVPLQDGIARLEALDIPCAPVMTLAELVAHPHVVETGLFSETEYPMVGLVREVRPPAQFSRTPAHAAGAAPRLGQHTESVLAEVGIRASALEAGKAAKK